MTWWDEAQKRRRMLEAADRRTVELDVAKADNRQATAKEVRDLAEMRATVDRMAQAKKVLDIVGHTSQAAPFIRRSIAQGELHVRHLAGDKTAPPETSTREYASMQLGPGGASVYVVGDLPKKGRQR